MLPRRCIARLLPSDGKLTKSGTGFAIDPQHLLTAFHVVGDRPTARLHDGPIRIEFHDDEDRLHWIEITGHVVAGQYHAKQDWALIRCDEAIPDCHPIALRMPRAGYGDPWNTYGYPGPAGALGKAYDGEITSYHPRLQLHCRQASQGVSLSGLSGAPCQVGGSGIGIIIIASNPKDTGYTEDGMLFVRSLADVAERCPHVKGLLPAREPPFVPQVESKLSDIQIWPLLPSLKGIGELPKVAPRERAQLAPLVAERLLLAGSPRALHVLKQLEPLGRARARSILDEFVASAWIDDGAARILADAIRAAAPRTVIGLNVEDPELCERYIHCAGYPTENHPGWQKLAYCLQGAGGEKRRLRATAIDELARRLACEDLDELKRTYAARDHALAPLVLMVPPPAPSRAEVEALHVDFEMVRLVILCGASGIAALRAEFPEAAIVEPLLVCDQETRVRTEHHASLVALEEFYDEHEKRAG